MTDGKTPEPMSDERLAFGEDFMDDVRLVKHLPADNPTRIMHEFIVESVIEIHRLRELHKQRDTVVDCTRCGHVMTFSEDEYRNPLMCFKCSNVFDVEWPSDTTKKREEDDENP